jgi:hypothetical protein
MTGFSVIGAVVSFARPKHVVHNADEAAASSEPAASVEAGAPTEVAAA